VLSRIVLGSMASWLVAACLALGTAAVGATSSIHPPVGPAGDLFHRVIVTNDHQRKPFMIIDKRRAHLWVFDADGQRLGDAPVLLGSARGDHTAPGIGDLQLAQIKPEDRTTPAGRFVAQLGKDLRGEEVMWVDYDSGVSIHRVLTSNPYERRLHRLASPTPDDNRITYGCINVEKTFFDQVVMPVARAGDSVVYILPESSPMQSVFGALAPLTPSVTAVQ
jgi:hypothetical protein